MRVLTRQWIVTICILGLLLGSLSPTLGRVTPAVAATSSGAAYAWGLNSNGQLGNGTTSNGVSTPEAITLAPDVTATAIAAGQLHSLAIGSDGKRYAWGSNYYGQLGNGSPYDSDIPVAVTLRVERTPLALGIGSQANHSLAILTSSGDAPTAAILASFHAVHTGGVTRFHWRVAAGRAFAASSSPPGRIA